MRQGCLETPEPKAVHHNENTRKAHRPRCQHWVEQQIEKREERASGDRELARLAERIDHDMDEDVDSSTLLEDESESMLLAEAPDEVWAEAPAAQPQPEPPVDDMA